MFDVNPADLEAEAEERRRSEERLAKLRADKKEKSIRRRAFIRKMFGTLFRSILILTLGLGVIYCFVYYQEGEKNGGLIKQTVTDFRNCVIKVPGTESVITGTRSYTYRYSEFNGWRWYNKEVVTEETKLDIQGESLSIIGMSLRGDATDTWVKSVDKGERYPQLVQNRDRYTILYSDKKIPVTVDYRDMCK